MSALLNAEQAAEYLGGDPITATTMRNLVRRKEIRHVRVGRAIAFPIDALDEYIADHTVPVQKNPWGLTDASLARIRSDRLTRPQREQSA